MEKPSLEDFIAALPECPDCGQKLHRFAYCPGRSRIRSEAMQDPTKTEKEGTTMSSTVVKQDQPSEKVDTDAVHATNKAALDAALFAQDEGKSAERKADIAAKAKAMAKGSTKAAKAKPAAGKPARKATKGNTGNAFPRLTDEWLSAKKKDVQVKDHMTLADGTVIECIGRWTKHKGDALIPMVTGRVVLAGGKKGDRKNAVAAEVTHVKK